MSRRIILFGVLAVVCFCACAVEAVEQGEIYGWGAIKLPNDTVANINQIAGGGMHSLALKSDGSIIGWGINSDSQSTPPVGTDFVAIAAGGGQNLALKSDGSIVGWGMNDYGEATPPTGNDFIAISAGEWHSLALKSDGIIIGWGRDDREQAAPPGGITV